MTNIILTALLAVLLYISLDREIISTNAVFEPKLIRRAHYWTSGMNLHLIREYSTPAHSAMPIPCYSTQVPVIDPNSGLPYDSEERRLELLADLKPVSP